MKNENPWIDSVDGNVRDFIFALENGDYDVCLFASTLKHLEMILDNLFLYDEDMEREVLDILKSSLKEKRMKFVSDNKMTCFIVSILYQMIIRDDMFNDVIYIREEISPSEWDDDDNNNSNQNDNGKNSSENQADSRKA